MSLPSRLLPIVVAAIAVAATSSAQGFFDELQQFGWILDELSYRGEAVLDVPADEASDLIPAPERVNLGQLQDTMQLMQQNGDLSPAQAADIEQAMRDACSDGSGVVYQDLGDGSEHEVVFGNADQMEFPQDDTLLADLDGYTDIEGAIVSGLGGVLLAAGYGILEWEMRQIGQNVAAMVQADAEFVVMCGDVDQGMAELGQLYQDYYPTPGAVVDEYFEHAMNLDPALVQEAAQQGLDAAAMYSAGRIVQMMGPNGVLVIVIVVEAAIVVDQVGQIVDAMQTVEQNDQIFVEQLGGTQEELDQLQQDYENAGATGLSGYFYHLTDYYFSWL